MIDLDLTGIEDAINGIGAMEGEVRKQAEYALEASTVEIQNDAKDNAPVQSGNLMNSIQKEEAKGGTLGYVVFTGMEYAKRVEFGFSGEDSLGRSFDQSGQFYLTKAAMGQRGRTILRVRRAISRATATAST